MSPPQSHGPFRHHGTPDAVRQPRDGAFHVVPRALRGWDQIDVAIPATIALEDQLRRRQLEYRIIALNHAGKSPPGNTVAVVL